MAGSSAELVLSIVREISSHVNAARKTPLSADGCVINRRWMLDQMDRLNKSLPSAITTAVDYVANIELIRQQTEQDCTAQRRDAQAEAQRIISEAQAQAKTTYDQSEREPRNGFA